MATLPDSLSYWFADTGDVATQHRTLEERCPGIPHHKSFGTLVTLMNELVLSDAGRLGAIGSPNHARIVTTARGEHNVLKLSVDAPGDEPFALRTWAQTPRLLEHTPDVFAWGRTDDGLVWSLQERLAGVQRSRSHLRENLLPVLRHACDLHAPFGGCLDALDALRLRIAECVTASDDAALGNEIAQRLDELDGSTGLVHGNLSAENLLWEGSRFALVGAWGVPGLPSSDVARLLVDAYALTGEVALHVDPLAEELGLIRRELRTLTAAELFLRAIRSRVDGGRAAQTLLEQAWRCLR